MKQKHNSSKPLVDYLKTNKTDEHLARLNMTKMREYKIKNSKNEKGNHCKISR